jgi:hypothetical protein
MAGCIPASLRSPFEPQLVYSRLTLDATVRLRHLRVRNVMRRHGNSDYITASTCESTRQYTRHARQLTAPPRGSSPPSLEASRSTELRMSPKCTFHSKFMHDSARACGGADSTSRSVKHVGPKSRIAWLLVNQAVESSPYLFQIIYGQE